jgi:hypothetical protein
MPPLFAGLSPQRLLIIRTLVGVDQIVRAGRECHVPLANEPA